VILILSSVKQDFSCPRQDGLFLVLHIKGLLKMMESRVSNRKKVPKT